MKLGFKQNLNHLSCEETRKELAHAIDYENKRSNVDNAKKRAVTQHMDYEGFRQMVLGAHITSIRSKDLNNFSLNGKLEKIFNPNTTTFSNVRTLDEKTEISLPKMDNQITEISTFRVFRTFFTQIEKEEDKFERGMILLAMLEIQTKENLFKTLSYDFDPVYFIKILEVFEPLLLLENFDLKEDFERIAKLLKLMKESKDFNLVIPKFLSKIEKSKVKEFMTLLSNKLENDEILIQLFC